jgi:hypothetical protein
MRSSCSGSSCFIATVKPIITPVNPQYGENLYAYVSPDPKLGTDVALLVVLWRLLLLLLLLQGGESIANDTSISLRLYSEKDRERERIQVCEIAAGEVVHENEGQERGQSRQRVHYHNKPQEPKLRQAKRKIVAISKATKNMDCEFYS